MGASTVLPRRIRPRETGEGQTFPAPPALITRFEALRSQGLALSVASLAELGLDEEMCRIFGRERGRLRKAGQLIGDFDLFIAATGLHYGLTVPTNNRQNFDRVEGLPIESV